MHIGKFLDVITLPIDILTGYVLGHFDHHLELRKEPIHGQTDRGYRYVRTDGRYFRCRKNLYWLLVRIPGYGRPGCVVTCYNRVVNGDIDLYITDPTSIDTLVNHSVEWNPCP